MIGSENTTALPFAHLPRATLEAIVELAISELDRRDGDADAEPSCGDLHHLADDDTLHRLDAAPLRRTNLFRREGRRHAA